MLASYFDLGDGALRCVPTEPATVAAIAGLRRAAVTPRTRGGAAGVA